ncbi:MAG: phenylalanine--tRNA ligase subunit alpha, partial [Clostridia bacterium]|nr:phenylalanine--tRNA ligase subunit alpha [Clostridia bacterium]
MSVDTNSIRSLFEEKLQQADNAVTLEELRVAMLGKKGVITEQMKNLRSVEESQRKAVGQQINELKQYIDQALTAKKKELEEAAMNARIQSAERYDVSMPGSETFGSLHPITTVAREVEEVFRSMGFTVEDYFEIVDDYQNFEALNIPKHHPARDMQDTYFLSNGQLLKTHTSAAQNAIMKKYGAPLRSVFPSRCFR